MQYFSLNGHPAKVSFKEAVINSLAPDKGLYFPGYIPQLSQYFFDEIALSSDHQIAYEAIQEFIGDEIPSNILYEIIEETLNFPVPLIDLSKDIFTLELFHGPTMAFKDVGARFMARCLGYFNQQEKKAVTVLVATSGDTGGAVASGFLGVEGVKVIILYPKGKVSPVQEKQLTTLGQNITALEVDGTFDDCQSMVKEAFLDKEITDKVALTSANSINIARWLPQMFYYFFAWKQLKDKTRDVVFSVPSGNFGNICAGMMTQQLGLPVKAFVAATNINDVVPRFMETGLYETKPSHQTISNAMDVGNPSNFIRIQRLFNQNTDVLKQNLKAYSFTDEQTKEAIRHLKTSYNYIADPHGAVGYLGLKKYQKQYVDSTGVFLETAHPVKFPEVVETVLNEKLKLSQDIEKLLKMEKQALEITRYEHLKEVLLK